ncbi:MAG: hypothetical protein SFV55_25020 [Haliscomenobacter sp.]|uniref:hypothetical protein n=1 Tax=Haliscomenobacter sp. TaxID=2717303 RepID=UPI0029BE9497|nr:hypothetical protein [Haliscomenobacter sp.]MDX2071718.1 hypothetical protein [Haliscomenobacter sp.]
MSTKPSLYPPKPGFLLLEVVYGLVSRDCRGMGICKFIKASSSLLSTTTNPCGSSIAWGGVGEEGKFELLVLRNTVSKEQWDRRFTSGEFVVEEAFQVPEELFAAGMELKVGSYPVEVVGEYLRISF